MASNFDPDAYLAANSPPAGGFDPDAYLGLPPKQKPGIMDQFTMANLPGAMKQAVSDLVEKPANIVKQGLTMSPQAQKVAAAVAPIAGGALGAPFGLAAPGAAAGDFIRQAANTVIDPNANPKTPLGNFGSAVGAGIAQDPKILGAIPGANKVGDMIAGLASKVGKGAAKFGEALTGAKAKDLEQAAKQGVSTYGAPSMEKAQQIFDKALKSEGISSQRPLEQVLDPQLANARDVALNSGKKFEAFMGGSGIPPTAEELLRGRQAVDRIYNATPLLDRSTRAELSELRSGFDDMLSTVSGKLGDASKTYRQAIVKSNILNPFRITKQGQISAVAPMVAALASSIGAGSGHKEGAGIGGLGYLAASSPAIAGALATGGGSLAQGFGALAARPEVRQALLQLLERMANKPNATDPQPSQ